MRSLVRGGLVKVHVIIGGIVRPGERSALLLRGHAGAFVSSGGDERPGLRSRTEKPAGGGGCAKGGHFDALHAERSVVQTVECGGKSIVALTSAGQASGFQS